VKGTPQESLQFRDAVTLEVASPGGVLELTTEVVSILAGVGVAVAFPASRVAEVRALLGRAPEPSSAPEPQAEPAGRAAKGSLADKIQIALHGNRDERAANLRDPNKSLYPYVLKNPQLTVEEVLAWAKNPEVGASFLKLIAERKDWFTRPAIAEALARNPRTPADLAIRAVDYVPKETLRQMAKGMGRRTSCRPRARR